MATYTQTQNTEAVYGEQSPAVLALQKQLNSQYNAGLAEDSKYGPLTLAAYNQYMGSQNNSPATSESANQTPNINTSDYYSRRTNPNQSDLNSLLSGYESALGNTGPNANQVAERKKLLQEVTDAINSEYAKYFDMEGRLGEGREARTRALNVSAGLGGSDFGSAAATKTEDFNKGQMELLQREKSAKLAAAISGVEDRMSSKFRQEREDQLNSYKDKIALKQSLVEQDRANAEKSITGFATQGVSAQQLRDSEPDIYNQLLTEYGGSPLDLEVAWNNSLPDELRIKYEQEIIKGKDGNAIMMRYGIDPRTGKLDRREYDMGVNYDQFKGEKPIELDGVLYTRESDGSLKPLTGTSDLVKSQIAENYAQAEKARRTIEEEEGDPDLISELQDAQAAIAAGANPDDVRRMFLDLYPKKGDLFLKYTKQEF